MSKHTLSPWTLEIGDKFADVMAEVGAFCKSREFDRSAK